MIITSRHLIRLPVAPWLAGRVTAGSERPGGYQVTDYNSLAGGVHGFSRYEFGFLFYLSQLCRGRGCGGLFLLFVVETLDVSVNVAALRAVLSLKCSILSCLGQFGWGVWGGGR